MSLLEIRHHRLLSASTKEKPAVNWMLRKNGDENDDESMEEGGRKKKISIMILKNGRPISRLDSGFFQAHGTMRPERPVLLLVFFFFLSLSLFLSGDLRVPYSAGAMKFWRVFSLLVVVDVAVVVVAVAVAVVVVVVVAQNGTRRKVGPIGARVFHFRNSSPDFHHTFFFFLPGRGRIALRSFFRFPIFFFL